MNHSMKIALITPGITPYVMGGMQTHSFNLVRHLSGLGVEIDLYHTDFGNANNLNGLKGMTAEECGKISSIALPWPKGDRFPGHYLRKSDRFSAAVLKHIMERPAVDFIYIQGFTGGAILKARKKRNLQIPVGVNFHGLEAFQRPSSFMTRLHQPFFRQKTTTAVTTADVVFSFGGKIFKITKSLGVHQDRIAVIPNGFGDQWRSTPRKLAKNDLRRFIFVGRYERRKAIEEINQALLKIRDLEGWEFHFVGPIPEKHRIKNRHIIYHGSVSDSKMLIGLVDECDVLVCPSYSEGMPTVILEAMARGLAVIATDVGAVSMMVDSENGILMDHVSVNRIEGAIRNMIDISHTELNQLKDSSLARSEQFTWDLIALQTWESMKAAAQIGQ